ncbi:DUF4440 domain-containing protein [Phenylobacterium immobile]|uniref:DUF4440 domain-containing protein n=1 Tax=Phenylobacterium immobile TaxID=21 RepID=UPI000AD7F05F|nr:DUF4440 domain-containing protein [Phenylobacterium immobile]
MRRSSLLAAAIMAVSAPAFAADPAPVVAAEHAFAKSVGDRGVRDGFLAHMADDAVVFSPDAMNAKTFFTGRPPGKAPKDGGTLLTWWPTFAGLAASGDLGFTTGPAEADGKRFTHYFTVWKRQADGGWKWVYDGGVQNDASHDPGPGAPVSSLSPGQGGGSFAEVEAAETALAKAALTDQAAAYRAALAPDAHVQGSPGVPAASPDAVKAEIATRGPTAAFARLGGEASQAGDLAWTYGIAAIDASKHYVRIWRRGPDGWRIVYDQVL